MTMLSLDLVIRRKYGHRSFRLTCLGVHSETKIASVWYGLHIMILIIDTYIGSCIRIDMLHQGLCGKGNVERETVDLSWHLRTCVDSTWRHSLKKTCDNVNDKTYNRFFFQKYFSLIHIQVIHKITCTTIKKKRHARKCRSQLISW